MLNNFALPYWVLGKAGKGKYVFETIDTRPLITKLQQKKTFTGKKYQKLHNHYQQNLKTRFSEMNYLIKYSPKISDYLVISQRKINFWCSSKKVHILLLKSLFSRFFGSSNLIRIYLLWPSSFWALHSLQNSAN